jgi:surfactin synthase thioesterase subunit
MSSGKRSRSIAVLRTGRGAMLRLFCFPYAGAGVGAFYRWKSAILDTVELCAIQMPGREDRLDEAPITSMEVLRRYLAEQITPYLDRPCVFFGHSLGALVAFETVRELRRRGLPLPVTMILSGRRAPQIGYDTQPWHTLANEELVARIRGLGGTRVGVLEDPQLRDLLLPLLRADLTLNETYQYRPEAPLPMPATLLRARDDSVASLEQADAWRLQFRTPPRCVDYDGGHFFIDVNFHAVIAEINHELSAAVALAGLPQIAAAVPEARTANAVCGLEKFQ